VLARVLPRLMFEPQLVAQTSVDAWCERLLAPDGAQTAMRLFEASTGVSVDVVY